MLAEKNLRERLERIMNQLADSVLELPDDAITAEMTQAGANPHEEAERVRLMLRENLKSLEIVRERLSNLGHTINPRYWWSDNRAYHNNCLECGSLVSFTIATNETHGHAFEEPCAGSRAYAVNGRRRNGTGKYLGDHR